MNDRIKRTTDNSDDETIVAVITPPGEGGIAALRIAGRHSLSYLKSHFLPKSKKQTNAKPFLMHFGHFIDSDKIDSILFGFRMLGVPPPK